MALESVTNIADLVITNPTATDAKSEGDDHIRNIKKALKTDLPNITGPITATQAELNVLDGITASTAELNLLDGVTATTAELNYVDGVTSPIQTQLDGKQPLDADLTAIAGLSSTGMVARTGAGTASVRTLTAGAGITITNGDGVSGNPTIAVNASDLPNSAAVVSYTPAGTGAVATTVQSKLRERISVKDYGAVGDGVTNDYAAIVNAKTECGITGAVLHFPKGTYFIGANELVFSEIGIVIECDAGVEIQGNGGTSGGFVVSFAKSGGTSQIVGTHPTNQRATGLRVRTVAPFSVDGGRAAIRVCGSYNIFTDCSAVTSADNGSNGWRLEADDSGSGPYYNSFVDCNIQGPQNGAATGSGIMMRQKPGTAAATRYPNTNTFIGGRVGGYAINVEISGGGNRFVGVASENFPGYGTAFKWNAPVANSNFQNDLISPYIENAAIAFEVQANSGGPQVFGYYATGVTMLISDPSNRLTVFGGDGVRSVRLAKAPNTSAARSGIYLGNTANADAETLDWYEEVTFTPIMVGSTSLGAGTTHSAQVGRATRIGNRVFFSGACNWTASTETGNIQIDLNDIPWTSSAVSNTNNPVSVRANTLAWTAGKQLVGVTITGTKRFQLDQMDPAGGAVAQVPMDTAAGLFFSGSYFV